MTRQMRQSIGDACASVLTAGERSAEVPVTVTTPICGSIRIVVVKAVVIIERMG